MPTAFAVLLQCFTVSFDGLRMREFLSSAVMSSEKLVFHCIWKDFLNGLTGQWCLYSRLSALSV